MKKKVYNQFQAWCDEFTVYGYRFYRVDDYVQKVIMLQHRASGIDEFELVTTTGKHVSTAYVDLPADEKVKARLNSVCKSLGITYARHLLHPGIGGRGAVQEVLGGRGLLHQSGVLRGNQRQGLSKRPKHARVSSSPAHRILRQARGELAAIAV